VSSGGGEWASRRDRLACWAWLLLLLVPRGVGGAVGAPGATVPLGEPELPPEVQEAPWLDADEAMALLQELEAGGLVLSERDWSRLGLSSLDSVATEEAAVGPTVEAGSRRNLKISGRCHFRAGQPATSLWRLTYQAQGWSIRGRWRGAGADTETQPPAGCLLKNIGRWELAAGSMRLRQGQGLLLAGPGSSSTPRAAASLHRSRSTLVPYSGAPDGRALQGLAGACRVGGLRLETIYGSRYVAGRPSLGELRLARLCFRARAVALDALGVGLEGSRGASLAVTVGSERRGCYLEAASWRAGQGGSEKAWVVGAHLAASRWEVAGQIAAAVAAEGFPLARRVVALPGWQGSGWVGRLGWRPLPGTKLRVLAAHGQCRQSDQTGPRTEERAILEILMARRWRRVWLAEARLQWRNDGVSGWQDRQSWLAPVPLAQTRRQLLVLSLERSVGQLDLGGSLRRLVVESGDRLRALSTGDGPFGPARWLLSLTGDFCPSPRWRLRAGTGTAWGSPQDLVSVTAPVSGVAMPRHWGGWRDEWYAGAEYRLGAWLVQLGVAFRTRTEQSLVESEDIERRSLDVWSGSTVGW
jgi:hypothetical protein